MTELFDLLFGSLPLGVMTVLNALSIIYWVFVLFSGEGIDFGLDSDLEFEGLGDVNDVDADGDIPHDAGFFSKALDFINVGKAPFMVIITLFKFISWVITIAASFFISLAKFGYWSLLILIPVFLVTYFIMHWLTKPIARFYESIGYKGEEPHDFFGRTGIMKSSIAGEKMGSAEFIINKYVIRLNVKSINGETIGYNDEIIIVDESKDQKIYLVKKEINIHNI